MRWGVASTGGAERGLWLPVFLLWPPWLLVLMMFLLATLVATGASGTRNFAGALAATRQLYLLASCLRGAQLELPGRGGKQLSFSFV
jgi:hypothetical protein